VSALKAIPIRCDGFTWREVDTEAIFLSEDGETVHVLNELGLFLWQLVDGTRTMEDMLDAVCSEYEVARDVATRDLLAFMDRLAKKGIVQFDAKRQP
jgi:hypothetical protein